ncbi:unnamed protein product [Nippostrongylus brasiliensis]|uniref:Uncharacterized protein n=1 Tax=Nippostrongylus brasiliensis TaxID=27835 RepID=A0A0N4Y2D0_NIPBR|nr:unnamed protein product [Nippostrongylus brasiliensis]
MLTVRNARNVDKVSSEEVNECSPGELSAAGTSRQSPPQSVIPKEQLSVLMFLSSGCHFTLSVSGDYF